MIKCMSVAKPCFKPPHHLLFHEDLTLTFCARKGCCTFNLWLQPLATRQNIYAIAQSQRRFLPISHTRVKKGNRPGVDYSQGRSTTLDTLLHYTKH